MRCVLAVALALALVSRAFAADGDAPVHFDRDIRPLLSDTCYQCHGPDDEARQSELRLDTKAGAFAEIEGRKIIVPGKPNQSELYRRITAADPDERMPPADADRKLSREQIELIRRWIDQGAEWQEHWAFIPPTRPLLPKIQHVDWPRNALDHFILARLEREGLTHSEESDRERLIRRVTLDLTGLPPTPDEVDAFLADDSPNAYEKVVDRLLTSPRYGEQRAIPWLDAARYADTSGYQNDGPRQMWRWRDWVIDAYNANMPFDRFTVEQLAGDLLPDPTLEQRIATGFNRNHRGNAEGGIVPEEFQVEYVVDRVETTCTVWLGLTMGCARCHDHKYDPLAQKEFYGLFAYFNNLPEYGRAIKEGNSPPLIKAPTSEQRRQLADLEEQLAIAEKSFAKLQPKVEKSQTNWEKTFASEEPITWTVTRGLKWHDTLDGKANAAGESKEHTPYPNGEPQFAGGKLGRAMRLDNGQFLDAGPVAKFGYFDKFSFAAWIHPDDTDRGTILSKMTDVDRGDGYQVCLHDGRIQVNFVKRWLDDSIRVETQRKIAANDWYHVLVTYDGSRVASGITVYVDGRAEPLAVQHDFLNQSFENDEPLRIGAGGGPDGWFHGLIDDVRICDVCLSAEEAEIVSVPQSITEILVLSEAERTDSQRHKLRAYFLAEGAAKPIRRAYRQMVELQRRHAEFLESLPTVMVMQDMETPRETHVLVRGQYDKPGEHVIRSVPSVFPKQTDGAPTDRLGLASWLIDPSNPLTARVAVNRYWQLHFGAGLVKTTEDFGTQGERPSHPELLDWLATEFVRSGWDVKAMHRLIVTSATYRQSSRVTPKLVQKDPENRLLARGPRVRLPAEVVRDQALAAAGLLTERLRGPSVKPYQPEGLWKEIATDTNYEQDHGPDLYRRSLYTYWKRTVVAPTMVGFDASTRESCVVRRPRTNTPLQALTVMNDVTFVEAARVLAQRAMREAGPTRDRLGLAFRLLTARRPRPVELEILESSYRHHHERFQRDPDAAKELLSAGEFPCDETLEASELAAYTAVCSLMMNLDEVVMKE